jgi:hypothetical protein
MTSSGWQLSDDELGDAVMQCMNHALARSDKQQRCRHARIQSGVPETCNMSVGR